MADKPIYYGSSSKGRTGGPAYYGRGPAYYGAGRAYGTYGARAYGETQGGGMEDGSVVGTITLSRVLRVVSQRWLSIFVFLLVGLVVSFAVYRISPTIYETSSDFSMDMRRSSGGIGRGALDTANYDFGNTYQEIFNTRMPDWRSEKIVTRIVQQYRANNPASTASDEEIIGTLVDSKMELQRNSRIITISLRSQDARLAAALANAYAEAIEAFTDEENKIRCDKAVARISGQVEKTRREVNKLSKQILDFRTANKVDNLRSSRDTLQQGLSKITADILMLETEETQLVEWERLLAAVQKDPETYGNLSTGVPRAEEIAAEYRAFQDASSESQSVLVAYTDNHPEAIAKKKALEIARERFVAAAARALQTGRSMLQIAKNRLANLRAKQEEMRGDLSSIEQRIVLAESGLAQLESEYKVAYDVLQGLILDESKARLEAESNNEIVRVGRTAKVPTKPVLPNPIVIFGAGVFLSLGLGFLFVLVLDNLEDTIVNLSDIEGRLALKVLAVLPHVRRKKREQVARNLIDEKYSQFSEAVAGLRNLLDSPRYESLTRCVLIISTQPGEGKTITSTSLAIAYAQAGKKTLLVDFDMRRPRLSRIWGLELTAERSLSHVLQRAVGGGGAPSFASLVNETLIEGFHVISSLPPEGVSPAQILGSSVVSDFFEWARANYDRVIVDSPPYGVVGDVVSLSALVDSAIIMCCPDRTHFKPIQFCSRSLTEAGANILGVVVNDIEFSSASAFSPSARHHRSYYGGGYGYGYGYGYRPEKAKPGDTAPVETPHEEFSDDE